MRDCWEHHLCQSDTCFHTDCASDSAGATICLKSEVWGHTIKEGVTEHWSHCELNTSKVMSNTICLFLCLRELLACVCVVQGTTPVFSWSYWHPWSCVHFLLCRMILLSMRECRELFFRKRRNLTAWVCGNKCVYYQFPQIDIVVVFFFPINAESTYTNATQQRTALLQRVCSIIIVRLALLTSLTLRVYSITQAHAGPWIFKQN